MLNFACSNSGTHKCNVHFNKGREGRNGGRTKEQPNIWHHHRRRWWCFFLLTQETGILISSFTFPALKHQRCQERFPFVQKKRSWNKSEISSDTSDSTTGADWQSLWDFWVLFWFAESFQDPQGQRSFQECNQELLVKDSHLYCGVPFQDEMSSLGPENWCLLQSVIRYEQKHQQSLRFFSYFFW